MTDKKIALIATLDTKLEDTLFCRDLLRGWGHRTLIIDVGPLSRAETPAGFDSSRVAEEAGTSLEELVKTGQRDLIMETMGRGAGLILLDLLSRGELAGVLGLGGNQGTAISSLALRGLPLGLPKLLVSTVASGDIRPFIGGSDTAVMFSVGDLLGGPNPLTGSVLANAAAALAGMVERGRPIGLDPAGRTVGLTELGNTEPAARRAVELLAGRGVRTIPFHASGAGGSAMEELIRMGALGGVFDLTPHELAEEVVGQGAYRPVRPGRLTAAGMAGLPQVVSLGALEYLCFGPWESIPPKLRRRKVYMHNPFNANVKVSRPEMARVGRVMAQRLNQARGPAAVMVPLEGWSIYGGPGGPLHDPQGNRMLLKALKAGLDPGVELIEVKAHINHPDFVDRCVHKLLQLMERASDDGRIQADGGV